MPPTPKNAPTAADYAFRQCPRCTVGVLVVTRFDPEALHEHGQTILADKVLSGGAVGYYCPSCEHGFSEAINPSVNDNDVSVSVKGVVNGRA